MFCNTGEGGRTTESKFEKWMSGAKGGGTRICGWIRRRAVLLALALLLGTLVLPKKVHGQLPSPAVLSWRRDWEQSTSHSAA